MTEEFVNKTYVQHYINKAESTESEADRNNYLYRAGTHMEVIECNGNDKLTSEQQQQVLDAANKLLGGK